MAPPTPVWFITACTSGFGEAIAHEALSRGYHVIATARNSSRLTALKSAGASVFDLDVAADDATLQAVFETASAVHGRITTVVNCAGYVLEGAVEECSAAEVEGIFTTNVLGGISVARAALPYLRAAAAGGEKRVMLANFGSLGSWQSIPVTSLYCSTKFAITGLSEGLAGEVAPLGIRAVSIEPGYFRTGFLNTPGSGDASVHRVKTEGVMDVYEQSTVGEMRKLMDGANNKQLGDVKKGAKVIVDVFSGTGVGEGKEVPVRLALGSDIVDVMRKRIKEVEAYLEEWAEVAKSTDH